MKVSIAVVSCSILTALKNKKGNVTLLRRMKNRENLCAMLQGLSRVLSASQNISFHSKKHLAYKPLHAPGPFECSLLQNKPSWRSVSLFLTTGASVFIYCCWPWLFMGCFPDRIAKIGKKKCCLRWIPVFVFLLSLSSFSQVYILPSHFHKALPVWLSFKVADEEVMKTRVVNCLQAKAVVPLKLTS